ncbi:hypothetical protein [Nocardia sp. NPDC057440]|uniref:hypothetical protein n=1 Tax=Nocardia sp. NPDC057440 TaxID=3346134 RepID=UPI00366D3298
MDELVIRADYTAAVTSFLRHNGLHRIVAFSGGADDKLHGVGDKKLVSDYEAVMSAKQERVVGDAIRKLRYYRIAVLTGGTKGGLPGTATSLAHEYGLKTIGVFPENARKKGYVLHDLLDLELEVPAVYDQSQWGDESPFFASLLHGVFVYGGSAGTLIEMAHVLKINDRLNNKEQPLKFIVPISGTGGVADGLRFIWAKPEIRDASMPKSVVLGGGDAAKAMIDQLELDDYYKDSYSNEENS